MTFTDGFWFQIGRAAGDAVLGLTIIATIVIVHVSGDVAYRAFRKLRSKK